LNILVVGCGRLGAKLANTLFDLGHYVSVIDHNPDSFKQLDPEFDGMTLLGNPMNMDSLRDAGIESCDSVAVVTSDDNLNITVCQIVKEFFYVENVVAKINSPSRERAFYNLGLKTVCPTNLACGSFISALTEKNFEQQIHFGIHTLGVTIREADSRFVGRELKCVPTRKSEMIIGIISYDGQIVLSSEKNKNIVLSTGDKIICVRVTD